MHVLIAIELNDRVLKLLALVFDNKCVNLRLLLLETNDDSQGESSHQNKNNGHTEPNENLLKLLLIIVESVIRLFMGFFQNNLIIGHVTEAFSASTLPHHYYFINLKRPRPRGSDHCVDLINLICCG